MEPKEYILSRLEGLKTSNATGQVFNSQKELIDFIYQSVMSKKFRKYSVDPEYQKHIYSAIELNVKNNEPIKIVSGFAAYKLWRLDESPEPDWAELFSMIYYAYWLKPIADSYKPGVWFDFYSDDIVVGILNNIPQSDIERYCEVFLQLLDFLKEYIPSNMKFTLTRIIDQYSSLESFKLDLDRKIKEIESDISQPRILNQEEIAAIDLNVKVNPEQSGDPKWREKVHLMRSAWLILRESRSYHRAPDKIFAFPNQLKNGITVGSTKNSIVKSWIGVGVLQEKDHKFIETILSPSQLQRVEYRWCPIDMTKLSGKNFKRVRIINKV